MLHTPEFAELERRLWSENPWGFPVVKTKEFLRKHANLNITEDDLGDHIAWHFNALDLRDIERLVRAFTDDPTTQQRILARFKESCPRRKRK